MRRYLDVDPWKVVESGFHPERQRSSESIFSVGNGRFGQRANHEEAYSGDSLLSLLSLSSLSLSLSLSDCQR